MTNRGAATLIRWILLLAGITSLVSCATSRGELLSETQAAIADETTDEKAPPVKPEPAPDEGAKGLSIRTDPAGAVVRSGLEILGITPLDLEDLEPGSYKLTIEKEGYWPVAVWIDFDGKPLVYAVDLEEITGFLQVTTQPEGARVTVDGADVDSSGVRLRIGRYDVLVRAFGYTEQTETVEIYEDTLTSISVGLDKAPFDITALDATRDTFSPLSFGTLGQTTVRFRVTAPGTAGLVIRSDDDRVVHEVDFPELRTWDQESTWQGRDDRGEPLPDGVYRVTLSGHGEDGISPPAREIELTIDSSAVIEYRSLLSGAAGLAYVGSPETLPPGSAQISALAIANVRTDGATTGYLIPVALGFRLGLESAEIDLQAGTYLSSQTGADTLPLYASISGRYALVRTRGPVALGVAAGARLAYHVLSDDLLTDFTGLGIQAPVRLSWGPVSLLAAPELVISFRRVGIVDDAAAFRIWGYGRAGLLVSAGPMVAGVSTAIRLKPFSEGLGVQLPLPLAAEAHLILPGTSIVISVVVSAQIESGTSYFIMAGGGFGILN